MIVPPFLLFSLILLLFCVCVSSFVHLPLWHSLCFLSELGLRTTSYVPIKPFRALFVFTRAGSRVPRTLPHHVCGARARCRFRGARAAFLPPLLPLLPCGFIL